MTITAGERNETVSAAPHGWDACARGWNDHTPVLRRWLAQATRSMIAMAGIHAGAQVIDVAAGTGDQSLDVAARVGPRGRVLATDVSPAMLAFAQANARAAGYGNVDVRVADGESLPVDDEAFDAAVCRLGLMFFDDPLQGLREIRRALRPGGGVCTVVFSRPDANPCVTLAMATAFEHAGVVPPDPFRPGSLFSLGRPGAIDSSFRQAGFRDVATTRIDAPFELPSSTAYVEFLRVSAGPIQQLLGRLDPAAADAAWADVAERLRVFDVAGGWRGPNELLLTAARR